MKKNGFWSEFRQFIAKGNVMNLAVGVIIGAAFQAITNSLVNDIIMPLISMLTGGIDFSDWKWVLKEAVVVRHDWRCGDPVRRVFDRNHQFPHYGPGHLFAGQIPEPDYGHRQKAGTESGAYHKKMPLLLQ